MSFSTRTWTVGETVTAAMLNTHISDNQADLDARAKVTEGAVDTDQTTASTSYTDLATVGPSVTVVTGTRAVVVSTATFYNDVASQDCLMSFAISGATTGGAADNNGPRFLNSLAGGGNQIRLSVVAVVNTNPGSNTFTSKYRVGGGTGHWLLRKIAVWPANSL